MLLIRVAAIVLSVCFCVAVCRLVARGKLLLRYSLLWLFLGAMIVFFSLSPNPLYALSFLMGFAAPSNFIFLIALFFLMAICLSLSVVVSRQQVAIKNLVQDLALLEKEIR